MMEEKVLKILEGVNEDIVTYEGDNLFDAGILDSLQTVELVSELEDAFDIDIDAKYMLEENFKTRQAIVAMIQKIIGEN